MKLCIDLTRFHGDVRAMSLQSTPWAIALLQKIERHGGITYANKPLLFEARIANAIRASGVDSVEYEHRAGVGDSSVDFRLLTTPNWLIEVVSIERSSALEDATIISGPYEGTRLSSPNSSQTLNDEYKVKKARLY